MKLLIKNASVVNEGKIQELDILIENQLISKIASDISDLSAKIIDASGKYILPG